MYPLNYRGVALTHQKVVPGNTITSLSAYCYKYRLYVLNYDAGTDEIVDGDWVIGASSGAVGKVVDVILSGGDWVDGNNAAGYLLIDSWNGTAWTNNEKIKVAADATCGDVDQAAAIVEASDTQYDSVYRLKYKDHLAQSALVVVYANTALIGIDGGKPDQTALIGIPMVANSSFELEDHNDIVNFKCVDYTASSASILQVQYFF
jgi:hypothetical protein